MIGVTSGAFSRQIENLTKGFTLNNVEFVDDCNLVIFSGGADISPSIYGQENYYSYPSPRRDEFELEILRMCLKLNKKILGICRGHQLINAFLGGDMVQDIYHDLKEVHGHYHRLEILQEGIISRNFEAVNSIHHQGVIKPGNNLEPTSYYGGVFESCESENIITVQFHPEAMSVTGNFWEEILEWSKKK